MKNISQGFRGPDLSATAPIIGESIATASAEILMVYPQRAVPFTVFETIPSVKNVAKTKVIIIVGKAELAQSNKAQLKTDRLL